MLACTGRNLPVKSAAALSAGLVQGEAFDRWLLAIGETAFKEAGAMDTVGYQLCKRAARAEFWDSHFAELASTICAAIGREAEYQKSAALDEQFQPMDEWEQKRAGIGWLSSVLGASPSGAANMAKMLAGGAVLAGGAGGSLAWAANRSVSEDDDDIEAMKAKIQTYRRLTADIENELALKTQRGY